MSSFSGDEKLLILHKRRLQILKQRAAQQGVAADPGVLTEIADIEQTIGELEGKNEPNPNEVLQPEAVHQANPPAVNSNQTEILPQNNEPPLNVSPSRKSTVVIENPRYIDLPNEAQIVLQAIFSNHTRIIIRDQFGDGFGGAKVLQVRPVRSDSRAELATVVKIGPKALIEQEWTAYRTIIDQFWPNVTQVVGEPNFPQNCSWGGLRYRLVGDGTFNEIESLLKYSLQAETTDILFAVQERLLKITNQALKQNDFEPDFSLRYSFDPILPVNLLIEPMIHMTASSTISPNQLNSQTLQIGDPVQIEGFIVKKVDNYHCSVTLDLPNDGVRAQKFGIRLKPVEDLARFQVGAVMPTIVGQVTETRLERLQQEISQSTGFTTTEQQTITLPDGTVLPNPLATLNNTLNKIQDIRVGYIHGDLNLENIIVDRVTRDIQLIDFAEARKDYVLHDFWRLEAGIITRLIPVILAQTNLGSGAIVSILEHLHTYSVSNDNIKVQALPNSVLAKPIEIQLAIRQAAKPYLSNVNNWNEYYQGLMVYLLGALRFKNLNELGRLPKQVAFWGAGVLANLMQTQAHSQPQITQTPSISNKSIPQVPPSKILRECLDKTFSEGDLRDFIDDYFEQVGRRLNDSDRKSYIIRQLIRYCEQRYETDKLWASLRIENRAAYEEFYPRWQQASQ